MAYVDLNPIRADIADCLDNSDFTSIEQRIKDVQLVVGSESKVGSRKLKAESPELKNTDNQEKEEPKPIKLGDFVGGKQVDGIPYSLMDYLELVDWTGRAIRDDKKGFISSSEPKILNKLGITADIWLKSVRQFSDHFYSHIGSDAQLKAVCKGSEVNWLAGMKSCRQLYQSPS